MKRSLALITAMLLIMTLFPMATLASSRIGTRAQPTNGMDLLLDGRGEGDGDGFGWNVSFVGDINNDGYDDLGVGAPFCDVGGIDAGAVYVFYGGPGILDRSNLSAGSADLVIYGTANDDRFGWDLDGAGDYNNDGMDDLVVGAPGWGANDQGQVYIFTGSSTITNMTADNSSFSQVGRNNGGNLGFSVTGCGDLDNDGNDDIAAGAPGSSEILVMKGFTPVPPIYVDLWDDNKTTPNVVDFTVEVNNTNSDVNTWGVYLPTANSDDGWDWDTGIRAYGGAGTATTITYQSPDENNPGSDSGTVTPNGAPMVGGIIQGMTASSVEDIAWGVQVNITTAMNTSINNGYRVFLQFDWQTDDPSAGGTEEPSYVKARIGYTNTTMNYLGRNLDGQDFWMRSGGNWHNFIDNEPEIWHYRNGNNLNGGVNFGINSGTYLGDVTPYVDRAGPLYIDAGIMQLTGGGGFGGDEGIEGLFTNFTMWMESAPTPMWITGTSGFGWDLDGGLDVNGDSTVDLIVSDPSTVRGTVYLFNGSSPFDYTDASQATGTFLGAHAGSGAGYSLSLVPDMNGDGRAEILGGAPFSDQAYLWYGRASFPTPTVTGYFAPWDDDNVTSPNSVEFEVEANNTDSDLNTFGIYPQYNTSDDGWDWDAGIQTYGGSGTASTIEYLSPTEPGGADTGTDVGSNSNGYTPLNTRQIGGYIQGLSTTNSKESLTWGVQFNVTAQINNTVNNGGLVFLHLDYEVWDVSGSGTEEPCYLKARAGHSNSTMTYVGSDLDGKAYTMQGPSYFNDPEPELFFRRSAWSLGGAVNFGTISGGRNADITDSIHSESPFYVDMGLVYYTGSWGVGGDEGFGGLFHNISLIMMSGFVLPDVTLQGTPGDAFGHSVCAGYRLNADNIADLIVGAPGNDSINGVDSGSIYTFGGSTTLPPLIPLTSSLNENWGEGAGAHFGWSTAGDSYLSGGAFSTVAVGAPLAGNSTENWGKAYVYEIPTVPFLTVTAPNGGEVVNGTINLNANATDPDDNIDAQGVRFYIRPDTSGNWTFIGADPLATGDAYSVTLDTTMWPDGDYWLLANVTDLDNFHASDISDGYFTIDNPYPPQVNFLYPVDGLTLNGTINLNATAGDVDGTLNTTVGMEFSWSPDNSSWNLLGNDMAPMGNLYELLDVNTTAIPDGTVYFRAAIRDNEGLPGNDTVEIILDNPNRPPSVDILDTLNSTIDLTGSIDLLATASDPDGNINASGVTFYYSSDTINWVVIGSDPAPDASGNYTMNFDTTSVNDGLYTFGARATDTDGLTDLDLTTTYRIHNNLMNPPIVRVLYPNGGEELFNNIWVSARVTDLEGNLDLARGVSFYYRADSASGWILINTTHTPQTVGGDSFKVALNTFELPDGLHYSVKAEAFDLTNLSGSDISDAEFKIHNTFNNAPDVVLTYPTGGESVSGTIDVSATVTDLEDNINDLGVAFYYYNFPDEALNTSVEWALIGNDQTPDGNGSYSLPLNTSGLEDSMFYRVRAVATDTTDKTGYDISGTFSIVNSPEHGPYVQVITPNGGETVRDVVPVTAIAMDMDGDLDLTAGVQFSFSPNGTAWTPIGTANIANGTHFSVDWDTNVTDVPNGDYYLRATVRDLAGNTASDESDATFTIDNDRLLPEWAAPLINITGIVAGHEYSGVMNLSATVTDADGDLDLITFYYVRNGSRQEITGSLERDGDAFWILWNSSSVSPSDNFQIVVVASDLAGHSAEATSPTFAISGNGGQIVPPPDDGKDGQGSSMLEKYGWCLILLLILLVIIIVVVVIIIIARRGKKNDDEEEEKEEGTPEEEGTLEEEGAKVGAGELAEGEGTTEEEEPKKKKGSGKKKDIDLAFQKPGEVAALDTEAGEEETWETTGPEEELTPSEDEPAEEVDEPTMEDDGLAKDTDGPAEDTDGPAEDTDEPTEDTDEDADPLLEEVDEETDILDILDDDEMELDLDIDE